MTSLRAAIDATPLLGAQTGVAAFSRGLIDALTARDDIVIRAFGLTWRGREQLPDTVPPGVGVVSRPMPANPLRAAWLRMDWPPVEWWTGPCDVVHGTNFVVPPALRAAEVVTVHDLTAVRFPQIVERASLAFPRLIERAVRRGAYVHTPSEFVREEVIDHFGVPPERVFAIHHGVPPLDSPPDGDTARLHGLVGDAPYVLALGTIEPRKDVPSLVRAFDSMARASDVTLVIAGSDGWGADAVTDAIASASHRDRVVRLGYVSAADRSALLRSAHVFAYPSIYEGFGFPPLEAMSVGVPVVATRAGALPEVLGDDARFVEGGDTDELAGALEQLLSNAAMRADLVERGRRHVERYRWDRTAQAMVQLYERAAA